MAIAGESLPDLPDPWGVRATGGGRWPLAAGAIAIALHVGLAVAITAINPARFHAETPIEIDVEEKQPPPPEVKPTPKEQPPPPPPERPRVVMKRAPAIQPATPPPAAPPPNEEPPKPAAEAPPVFGVTMSSTVAGPGGMAVPVGNTLMAKPGKPAPAAEVKPYSGEGTRPFTPVADMYISTYPKILKEVNGEDVYPPDAKRMGIEGKVVLKIGIDEKGNVVQVKLVERAGHGFDEAATKAMRESKFSPAIANDGRPVPFQITYTFRFDLTQ